MSATTDWLQVVLLAVNAGLIYKYLRATERIAETSQEQLEGQIRPAIVVRHVPLGVGVDALVLVNVGEGPALHIRLSPTERGSVGKLGLDLMQEIGFIEAGGTQQSGIRTKGGGITALNGRSLQCEYTSLSGRTYWTVADFDKFDNDRLIITRFTSDSK